MQSGGLPEKRLPVRYGIAAAGVPLENAGVPSRAPSATPVPRFSGSWRNQRSSGSRWIPADGRANHVLLVVNVSFTWPRARAAGTRD
jgi:hypothetical protein